MTTIEDKNKTVKIVAICRDEEGKKKLVKTELDTKKIDTIKYTEKKLTDKGLQRMERHPVDGLGGIGKPPPKSGHGGKYTWVGSGDLAESELMAPPPAIDEKDPNYVDEEVEEQILKGEEGLVVGEVEVAKVAGKGVGRVEVDPHLKVN